MIQWVKPNFIGFGLFFKHLKWQKNVWKQQIYKWLWEWISYNALRETNIIAPENRPGPKRKRAYSKSIHFSGANLLLVSRSGMLFFIVVVALRWHRLRWELQGVVCQQRPTDTWRRKTPGLNKDWWCRTWFFQLVIVCLLCGCWFGKWSVRVTE